MKKLNVAMIGYEFMGRAHSNAWRQVGKFFELPFEPVLKVVCGRNEEKVARAAAGLGWQEHSTSWEEVVRRKDIDIVDICTPGDSHTPIAIAAAQAKKVVFCEKPLANTLGDAQRMLDAVNRAGVLHMLCHNYRRVPRGRAGQAAHLRRAYRHDSPLPGHLFAGLACRSRVSSRLASPEGQGRLGRSGRHRFAFP